MSNESENRQAVKKEVVESKPLTKNKQVHLVLQGKGGVGKTFVATQLIQFLIATQGKAEGIDTDPVNTTFADYKGFPVVHLDIMKDSQIEPRQFDPMLERMVEEDSFFVVDNGASSFVPLSFYLVENEALEMIQESGKDVFIHTIVTGGQALTNTLQGMVDILRQMPPSVKIVVWLNGYHGEIVYEGKEFEQMKAYLDHKERILGIVNVPNYTGSTYGEDIRLMTSNRLTYEEVKSSKEFKLMAKSRLNKVKDVIFGQLKNII